MKLVLDQNLSYKLVLSLNQLFPGSKHVKGFGLTGDDDEAIWNFASDHQFTVETT